MGERLMRGGQAGAPPKSSQISYFHPGVKAVELVQKNTYGLRLLPSFVYDPTTMTVADMLSVAPYRNVDAIDAATQKPSFTDWFFYLKIHKMIGAGGKSFVSPLLGNPSVFDELDVDPLHNCLVTARRSTNADWRHLTDKPDEQEINQPGGKKYSADLRKYRVFTAVNALCKGDTDALENRIVVYPQVSQEALMAKLNAFGSRNSVVADPNWPEYVFGDVTSPMYGLWATVKPGAFNDAGMKTSLFHFGSTPKDDVNVGTMPWAIDVNTQWGQQFLAGRYVIPDMEHVTKISSAEEILDYIVTDNVLPYELIQQACGHKWDVPPQKAPRTTFPGNRFAGMPAPPTAPPVSAPVAAATYWIANVPGGPYDHATVMAHQQQTPVEIQVCVVGTQEWRYWLSDVLAPKQPPMPVSGQPVPMTFTPPPVPVAPAPQSMPVTPAYAQPVTPAYAQPVVPTFAPPPTTPYPVSVPPTFVPPPTAASAPPTMAVPRPPVAMTPTSVVSTAPPCPPSAPVMTQVPAAAPPQVIQPAAPVPQVAAAPTAPAWPQQAPSVQRPPMPPGNTGMQRPPMPTAPPMPPAGASTPPMPQQAPPMPQAAQPVAAAPLPAALNEVELAELAGLYKRWETQGQPNVAVITSTELQRFAELSDRAAANNQLKS